jgi:plasmid stabilization system protein ParE
MKAPLVVVFQRRATRDAEEIDAWWRENRPAAEGLFAHELDRMLAVVSLLPSLGAPARSERVRDVRRVVLRRTRYFVYYRVRVDTLQVLAIWHSARGEAPRL